MAVSGTNSEMQDMRLLVKELKVAGSDPLTSIPAATASVVGGVKKAAAQADSTAEDAAGIVTDFNALLAKLRTAGVLAAS
jgi:hypothetical protein